MRRELVVACSIIFAVGVGLLAAGQGMYWLSAVGLGLIFFAGSLAVCGGNRADL